MEKIVFQSSHNMANMTFPPTDLTERDELELNCCVTLRDQLVGL